MGACSSAIAVPRPRCWEDRARWDDALLDLPIMPAHGHVASGANAVPPPAASFNLGPATRKVIGHVVYVGTDFVDVNFPLVVARNAPPTGRVVHSYTSSRSGTRGGGALIGGRSAGAGCSSALGETEGDSFSTISYSSSGAEA